MAKTESELLAAASGQPGFDAWFDLAMHYYSAQNWQGAYFAASEALKHKTKEARYEIWMMDVAGVSAMRCRVEHHSFFLLQGALLRSPFDARLADNFRYCIEKHWSAYGSFVPALEPFGRFAETVLEFGIGLYSTRLFLDKTKFTRLKLLRSYENVAPWCTICRTWFKDDRWRLIEGSIPEISKIAMQDETHYDLAFVDGVDRENCLTLALERATIVALHDVENPGVDAHCRKAKYCRIFKDYRPWTALLSNVTPV